MKNVKHKTRNNKQKKSQSIFSNNKMFKFNDPFLLILGKSITIKLLLNFFFILSTVLSKLILSNGKFLINGEKSQ